ncbi:MAG: TonB-dependent receptor [Alphaproteobacteria bacterium]
MDTSTSILDALRKPAAALAVSGIALSASMAFAQDAPTAVSEVNAEDIRRTPVTGIETITTQAQKTEGDVQTTPISQTVVSGEQLQQAFAQDLRDLTSAAPNVILQPVGSFQNATAFFIRGAGSSDIESAADPGIAVLVDGVYMARTSTGLTDFLDVEAVEILRGPQGTLFGRNAIGGAVLLRHNAPDVNEFNIKGAVTAGQYGRLDVKGTVNVPLVEGTAAFRMAFKSTNLDGYYYNVFDDTKTGGHDRLTILPSIRFQNDNLDVVIRGEFARIRDDSYPTTPHNACRTDPVDMIDPSGNDAVINLASLLGGAEGARELCAFGVGTDRVDTNGDGKPDRKRDYVVNHDYVNGFGSNFDIYGITGEINYDIVDVGTITYIGNYRDVYEDVHNDFDTTPFDLFSTRRQQWHWQTSHELRFASDFSDFVDFVVGFYYFEQKYVLEQDTQGAIVGFGGGTGGGIFGRSEQSHDQWSVFGQANWNVFDRVTLVTGIRYTEEGKDFLHCGVGFGDRANRTCFDSPALTFNSDTDIGDGPGQNPGTNNWSNVSPKVGINFEMNDNTFLYASWARGYRSGGFNGRGNFPATAGPFDEERADSYEVGVKWDGLDNRLRLNLTLFWTEFSDLQRTIIRPASGGGGGQETVTENAANARSRGVELEMTAIPADGLTIRGSIGYLDADTLEWCADLNGPGVPALPGRDVCGDVVEVTPGNFLEPFSNAGLPILQAPEWTTNLNISYEFPVGNSGYLTLSADWLYRSSLSLVSAGFPPGTVDGVVNYDGVEATAIRASAHTLNLQTTWQDIEGRYAVSFFWKNVTGETYINTGTYVAGLFNFAQRNNPRHWGVEISFDL